MNLQRNNCKSLHVEICKLRWPSNNLNDLKCQGCLKVSNIVKLLQWTVPKRPSIRAAFWKGYARPELRYVRKYLSFQYVNNISGYWMSCQWRYLWSQEVRWPLGNEKVKIYWSQNASITHISLWASSCSESIVTRTRKIYWNDATASCWRIVYVFMAALRSRCGHYIFALWFLSFFRSFFLV